MTNIIQQLKTKAKLIVEAVFHILNYGNSIHKLFCHAVRSIFFNLLVEMILIHVNMCHTLISSEHHCLSTCDLCLTFFFVLVFKFKFLAFFFFWNHGEKELERSIYESSNVLKRRSKIIKVFPGISFDYFMHARKPICIFSCLTPTEGMMNLSLNGKGLLVCEFRVRLFYYSII